MTVSERVEKALALAKEPRARDTFILLFEQAARDAAALLDASGLPTTGRGIAGEVVTVKDNIAVAGLPTTAGSTAFSNAPPEEFDSSVVARLRDAGLVLLGRTNMTEFAFSGLGMNPHYGTPANPLFKDEQRLPGGSSSGGAVSVALGIARFAVGTDTGGSVRIPAAWCGLVGFKASAGAICREGVLPLSNSLDAIGVIAADVADCRSAFEILREKHEQSQFSYSPERLRIGIVSNYVRSGADDAVLEAFDAAIVKLRQEGVTIEELEVPELTEIGAATEKGTLAAVEAYAWHKDHLRKYAAMYDPRVLERIEAGSGMDSAEYRRLLKWRSNFSATITRRCKTFDAIAWPTVAILPPRFDDLSAPEAYRAANLLALRNSTIANLMDGCAVSLPVGPAGDPIGITLASTNLQDDHLLAVASAAEPIVGSARNAN